MPTPEVLHQTVVPCRAIRDSDNRNWLKSPRLPTIGGAGARREQHPGIVPVYELGQFSDERSFFSMKLASRFEG